MDENVNYNKLMYDAYLANQMKQQEEMALTEEQAKQRDEMVKDVRKQLAYKQMLEPAANLVDFFANTYRGGKVGGPQGGNISDNRIDPAISQQSAMIGWMGKPKISGSGGTTNPLQLAKFAYQQEKDAAKKEEAATNEKEIFKLEKEFRNSKTTQELGNADSTINKIDNVLSKDHVSAQEYNLLRQEMAAVYNGKRQTDRDVMINSGGQSWADRAKRFVDININDKMSPEDIASFRTVLKDMRDGLAYTKEAHLAKYAQTAENYGISPERFEKNFIGFIKPKSESKLYKQEKTKPVDSTPAISTSAPVREFVRDANGKLVEVTK